MSLTTAIAHPNAALCRDWGLRDRTLNLPATPSLSLAVAEYSTRATVQWGAEADAAFQNGRPLPRADAERLFHALDLLDPWRPRVAISCESDIPAAAGLGRAASRFASVLVAAAAARGRPASSQELGVLARRAGGPATRSLPGGWVEWVMGDQRDGTDSFGVALAPADHWEIRVLAAFVGLEPDDVAARDAALHTLHTSPYYPVWTAGAQNDVADARHAVFRRDIEALGQIVERASFRMHASMLAADPPLLYWNARTLLVVESVRELRSSGIGAWCIFDVGPSVKVLVDAGDVGIVRAMLGVVAERIDVFSPGGPARLVGPGDPAIPTGPAAA